MRAAIGLGFLVGLAGCLGADGPSAYGDAEHPMKAYDIAGLAPTGHEERVLASLKASLQRDGLWSEVKRAKSAKDILMIWATVRVHLRIIDLLEAMRQRKPPYP